MLYYCCCVRLIGQIFILICKNQFIERGIFFSVISCLNMSLDLFIYSAHVHSSSSSSRVRNELTHFGQSECNLLELDWNLCKKWGRCCAEHEWEFDVRLIMLQDFSLPLSFNYKFMDLGQITSAWINHNSELSCVQYFDVYHTPRRVCLVSWSMIICIHDRC